MKLVYLVDIDLTVYMETFEAGVLMELSTLHQNLTMRPGQVLGFSGDAVKYMTVDIQQVSNIYCNAT